MSSILLLVAAASLGVDYGYQPIDGGDELEYIIQIEPPLARALASGEVEELASRLPPQVRNVRRFRIVVGTDKLPRRALPKSVSAPSTAAGPTADPNDRADQAVPAWPPRESVAQEPNDPGLFRADPSSEPLAHKTVEYTTGDRTKGAENGQPSTPRTTATIDATSKKKAPGDGRRSETSEEKPSRPWLPLSITLVCLFASLGGNVYLGWIAWDAYGRCRAAVARNPSVGST